MLPVNAAHELTTLACSMAVDCPIMSASESCTSVAADSRVNPKIRQTAHGANRFTEFEKARMGPRDLYDNKPVKFNQAVKLVSA
jgi:hypothetical protein